MVSEVMDNAFNAEVLQSNVPVLVDYWAPWCGPCRAMGPILDDLAKEYGEQLKIIKMNVDDNPKTPGRYGIKSIPTLILYKGGDVMKQVTGVVSKTSIKEMVATHLASQ
jgi:thioredoxin 1